MNHLESCNKKNMLISVLLLLTFLTWSRQFNTQLQYSCLEDAMNGGAWSAAVHGVVNSRIWLSDFTRTFHFHALEKEMATHSSVLAWRIPGMGAPGGLPSMRSHRVGHKWSDLAVAVAGSLTIKTPCNSFKNKVMRLNLIIELLSNLKEKYMKSSHKLSISVFKLLLMLL